MSQAENLMLRAPAHYGAANDERVESSATVDAIASLIRNEELAPADVVTLLNAISSRMAECNGHLKLHQQIVDESDYLSDWINDEVQQ